MTTFKVSFGLTVAAGTAFVALVPINAMIEKDIGWLAIPIAILFFPSAGVMLWSLKKS